MNIHRLKVTGVFLATFLIVSACGGSSYGGSSPTPPPPPPPPGGDPVGGITRTGLAFSAGPVTAFGSVVVNGVRYDTSGANFTVDGQVATQADLAVGDMIVVKGTIDYVAVRGQEDGSGGLFAVIVELEELADPNTVFDTIVQGFLEADPAAQAFPPLNVLDVVINSNAGTAFRDEFDNPIPVASDFFNQLRAGSLIKAKGTQVVWLAACDFAGGGNRTSDRIVTLPS